MIPSRRGSTIVEAIVSISVLATAITGASQILLLSAQQRQAADRLLTAQLEVANVMERIAALPYDEVTSEKLRTLKISAESQAALPAAQLKIELVESNDSEPKHIRVAAVISWVVTADERASVQLTSWRYPAPSSEVRP